jgi:hypothetical protein
MVLVTLTLAFDLEPPHFVPRQRKDRSDASPALDHVKERSDISQARLPCRTALWTRIAF